MPSGPIGSYEIPVNVENEDDLRDQNPSFPAGTLVWRKDTKTPWRYYPTGITPPVGATTVPAKGGGFWAEEDGGGGDAPFRVRNVTLADIDPTDYVVAGNDGVTNVEGDQVLSFVPGDGADGSLCGPWVVGVVTAGHAPLTRPPWWNTGSVLPTGENIEVGGEGTLYRNTIWAAMKASDTFTVGTDDPEVYPRTLSNVAVLVAGTKAVTAPIRGARSSVTVSPTVANTPAATVRYATYDTGLTLGPDGAFTIQACVAAGTINVADISTLSWTLHNQ